MKPEKLLFTLTLMIPIFMFSQSVQNIQSELKDDNTVVIKYEITGGKFYYYYTIDLYISRDDGKTYEGPLKEVSGDVGANILKGKHTINWNAMKESPFIDQNFIFDVRATVFEEKIKPSLFISYVGGTSTPIGLRVGMIGKIGFYIEGRMNTRAFEAVDFTYEDGEIKDYDIPGYYEFTDGLGYSDFAVLGGLTYQPWRNIYLFAGVGYAWDKYLYKVTNYSYDDDQPTGTYNVVHGDYNLQGFEIDAGVMYRIKMLLLSAGVTTIGFENVGWTAGIGFAF